jgi:hypothetical protein
MSNYQVLYRADIEYPYLAILYKDLKGSPRTTPHELFAFNEQDEREIMMEEHVPVIVKNIHGSDVYQKYLDQGWMDMSHVKDLLPLSIQMWLSQNSTECV